MGTNYYVHIGKRSSIGDGKCEFTVAIPVRYWTEYPDVEIIDEFGQEVSAADFCSLISGDSLNYESMGSRFC